MEGIFRRLDWSRIARLISSAAIIAVVVALTGASASHTAESKLFDATTPLAELLNPDGTLNLTTGFRGSLDARGWRLVSGPDEAPRFAPASVPGDEGWASFFEAFGANSTVFALAISGRDTLYVGDASKIGMPIK